MKRLFRIFRLELFVIFLVSGVLIYQLFIPPIIGLADNGDFWRVMKWNGIQYPPGEENGHLFSYLHRTFVVQPETRWRFYASSEILFAHLGYLLNKWISKSGLFDIRILGFVHSAFFLAALLLVLRAGKEMQVPLLGIFSFFLILFFCDAGYIAYFNSFYAEPATLIFLLFTVGFGLKVIFQQDAHLTYLLAFFITGILFIGAKHQNSILGALLALFMLRLAFVWPQKRWRFVSILLAGLFCVSSYILLQSLPKFIKEAVLYNGVFYEILRKSPTPERDLEELGLDPGLIPLKGTHAFMPDIPINDPVFREKFFPRIGYRKIVVFYLRHPDRLWALVRKGAENTSLMRFPGYLGNFEKSAGYGPGAQARTFAFWSDFKERFFPKSLFFLLISCILYPASLVLIRTALRSTRGKLFLDWLLLLNLMFVCQFLTSILGGGEQDLVKHLFLFNTLIDLSILSVLGALVWVSMRLRKDRLASAIESASFYTR